MSELYSYDTYRGFTIVVERLDDGGYEGVYYKESYHNPIAIKFGYRGDAVRDWLVQDIEHYLEVRGYGC